MKLQANALRRREAEQLTRSKEVNAQAEGLAKAESRLQELQATVQNEAAALSAGQQAAAAGVADTEVRDKALAERQAELDAKLASVASEQAELQEMHTLCQAAQNQLQSRNSELDQRAAKLSREEAGQKEVAHILEERHQQLAGEAAALTTARQAVDRAAAELRKSETEVEETRAQLSLLYEHMQGVVTEIAARSDGNPGSDKNGEPQSDHRSGALHPAMGPIAEGLRLENYRARLRAAEAALLQREMELQQRASLAGLSGLDDELLGGQFNGSNFKVSATEPLSQGPPSDTGSAISQPPDFEG